MVVLVIETGAELVTRLRASFAHGGDMQFHHVEPGTSRVASAALTFRPSVVVLGPGVRPEDSLRHLWPTPRALPPTRLLAQRALTWAERSAWAHEGVAGTYDVTSEYPALVAALAPAHGLAPTRPA